MPSFQRWASTGTVKPPDADRHHRRHEQENSEPGKGAVPLSNQGNDAEIGQEQAQQHGTPGDGGMPVRPGDVEFLDQLERHRQSGASFVSLNVSFDQFPWHFGFKMLATFRSWIRQHPERYLLVDKVSGIHRAKREGKLGVAFDLEGAVAVDDLPELVEPYYALGFFLGDNDNSTETIVRHIDHVASLVGPEHVGLGLDFVFDASELDDVVENNPELFPPEKGYRKGLRMVEPERIPRIAGRMELGVGMVYASGLKAFAIGRIAC